MCSGACALSGRGSCLSPDASAYQRIISNNSYAHDEQGVNPGQKKRVRWCPLWTVTIADGVKLSISCADVRRADFMWQSALAGAEEVSIIIIIFVYFLIADITRNYYSTRPNIRHAGRDTTAATQGSTIYRRVKPAKLLPHTAHSDWINRTGLTSWAFTR